MKKWILIATLLFSITIIKGQVVTLDPVFATQYDSVTILKPNRFTVN